MAVGVPEIEIIFISVFLYFTLLVTIHMLP